MTFFSTPRAAVRAAVRDVVYPITGAGGWPLNRLLILGDSHIDSHTSSPTATQAGYFKADGPVNFSRVSLNKAFDLVERSNGFPTGSALPDLDHGYPGYTAASILDTYDGSYYPVTHALTKECDAVLVACGGNDIAGGADGATAAANVIAVGNALKAAGKPVIITGIFPRSSAAGIAIRDRIQAANAALPGLCSANGLKWLPWHTAVETDVDGYMTSNHTADGTHLLPAGAQAVGAELTEYLQANFRLGAAFSPPADGSGDWVTANPYMDGGATSIPTSWSQFGSATVTYSKHTDANGDVWQEVTISGNPSYNTIRFFTFRGTGAFWTAGDVVRATCQFQAVESGWDFKGVHLHQDVYTGATRNAYDLLDGGMSSRPTILTPVSGTLLTAPWEIEGSATQVSFTLQVAGNGTFRFRAAGIFKV